MNMEQLVDYIISDDEEDTSISNDALASSHTYTHRSQNISEERKGADYFGLDSSSDDEFDFSTMAADRKSEQRSADLSFWQGREEESGDFWMSTTSDDKANDHKRKQPPETQISDKRQKTTLLETCDGQKMDTSSCSPRADRKVYYIHHRVAPKLNQVPACFCPNFKMTSKASGHSKIVARVEWNVHQFSHIFASASLDGTVKIWNGLKTLSPSDPLRCFCNHHKAVKCVCWSNCGQFLLSGSFDQTARTVDVETGHDQCTFEHDSFVSAAYYHPVDNNLIVTGSLRLMQLWDIRSPSKSVLQLKNKQNIGQIQDLALYQDGRTLVCCSDVVARDSAEVNIMAWDVRNAARISNQIYQERYTCTRIKIHPHGHEFLAQSQGDYVCVFSTLPPYKMNKNRRYDNHKVSGHSLSFDVSPDGKFLVSGSCTGEAFVYDYKTSRVLRVLPTGSVCVDVSWHPVLPHTLATCTEDGHIIIWE